MADKEIKTIVDHIGRTVLGVVKKDTKDSITLFNPVIIHVQPDQQTGQLQVQSFPYIFMEFLKDKEETIGRSLRVQLVFLMFNLMSVLFNNTKILTTRSLLLHSLKEAVK